MVIAPSVTQLFEAQVKQTPDEIAVVFEEQQLTYGELNIKANQLAHYLQNLGVKPEVLVGICVERSLEMVIGLLAILKAGGAYVPLDPAYPAERLAYMLSDSQASVLLTQSQLASSLPAYQGHVICLDRDGEAISTEREQNPTNDVTPDNLAYVIYTSGSTGKPKGVQITHCSVVNLLSSIATNPGLTREDTLVAVTSISFDVSVFEIYLPLIVGARLVIANREVVRDATELIKLLVQEKTTIMTATPATWRMLLEAGWQISQNLKILCTGESLSRELADRLLEKSASVWNLYGPTEITIWATLYRVKSEEDSVSIGKAIANTATYILDAERKPVPVGEPGELYIGGLGLARGYLNRPELNSEKFITNPLANSPWERLYKTGDLVRYLPDGNIEFKGRIDDQVKIRGYRIELGEIEVALSQHSGVKQTVVVAREDTVTNKRLVAYIVPGSSSESVPKTDQQKEQWQEIWDEAYKQPEDETDPTFHIGGWNDSYTGKDLAPEQVREWVDYTVDRILALQPKRLLEIGCGTGLLLFRISPHCQHYYGTDLSGEAIRYLEQQLSDYAPRTSKADRDLEKVVTLCQGAADDLEELARKSLFDTAVINSVIQFFPSIDYLAQVLSNLVQSIQPGGSIFVGDVLSLPLLEVFHTSVQLTQAPNSLSTVKLQQRISERMQEKRLIINPEFFLALKETLPQISHVDIQLKRGHYQNELTRFRYDAVIHVGQRVTTFPKSRSALLVRGA